MTIDFSLSMAAAATQLHHAQNLQKHAKKKMICILLAI